MLDIENGKGVLQENLKILVARENVTVNINQCKRFFLFSINIEFEK